MSHVLIWLLVPTSCSISHSLPTLSSFGMYRQAWIANEAREGRGPFSPWVMASDSWSCDLWWSISWFMTVKVAISVDNPGWQVFWLHLARLPGYSPPRSVTHSQGWQFMTQVLRWRIINPPFFGVAKKEQAILTNTPVSWARRLVTGNYRQITGWTRKNI